MGAARHYGKQQEKMYNDKWGDERAVDERRNHVHVRLLAARRTGRAANRVYGKVTL